MDGGRMALDNKTSLLNTPLLSSSPRGAREHFSDSPFKHSRKDTSMDDSEHFTDGTLMEEPKHIVLPKLDKVVAEFFFVYFNRQRSGPVGAGGRAAERVVQSQRAHRGEEGGSVRAAQVDS